MVDNGEKSRKSKFNFCNTLSKVPTQKWGFTSINNEEFGESSLNAKPAFIAVIMLN